ncbi:uncharacterized protein LOC116943003 [Petromyzon marinus]|uniref:NADH dehydrogenase [ubiquinone] 1 subunit C1, mitochondrial n=1 Tax=Petromyzon marinus TaxID=7757 RepID=A0AAJ7WVL9_PETMA|nr:NADH dehydrogenase [ubiquinone] 1 subunit C1, mitochondrial [Petromyzon marinus]
MLALAQRLLARPPPPRLLQSFSRRKFTAMAPDYTKPNWPGVVAYVSGTVLLWGLLLKQNSTDWAEYEKRRGIAKQ